jgi:hypothetical protein
LAAGVDGEPEKLAESEKQVAHLKRQLGLCRQNSTTSSKPPSSDGLEGEPRKRGHSKKSSAILAVNPVIRDTGEGWHPPGGSMK